MRILMVTATYPPSANGVAVSVENLKNSLKKRGHQVKVLAPSYKDSKSDDDVLRYPSILNPFIKDYPIALFPGLKSIYKIMTSFKPEIVHAHHPFQIGYFADLFSDSFNAPLVFTYHTRYDLYAESYAEFLPKNLKVKLIEKAVNDFCEKVDLIISPSEYLRKYLENKFGYRNIVTVPSAIPELSVSSLKKNVIRKRLSLPNSKVILLTVSRLGKEKNLDVLISAMETLSDQYLLVIVGSGPDENRLKKLVANKGVKRKVKFVGKVLHDRIHLFYQSADVFFYSSQTETQGLVFFEAMTFGLPIVSVESPASREWVRKSFGVITKNDPHYLGMEVAKMNSKKIDTFSKAAKKYTENFSEQRISKQLIEQYENLLNKNQ